MPLGWATEPTPDNPAASDNRAVIQGFNQEKPPNETVVITEKERHRILFYMGAALLVTLLLTAGFGIAMVVFGKQVFVAHMVFAGLTVFLGLAHAVTAVVWFFPF